MDSVNKRTVCCSIIAGGLILGLWTCIGHFHRYSIEDQRTSWNDGVNSYFFIDKPEDTFSHEYYEKTHSVKSAVEFIKLRYNPSTDLERLEAAYDFTRKRFKHFMYPHHTLLTNPYLWLGEQIFPARPINAMFLADMNLRHSAVGACGNATVTFVEIFRAMGGKAQFATYPAHIVAEADIDGKKYLVDADLEALVPHSLNAVYHQPELIVPHYKHKTSEEIETFMQVFGTEFIESGYDAPPAYRGGVYRFMQFVEWFKWVLPGALVLIGLSGLFSKRSHLIRGIFCSRKLHSDATYGA